MGDRSDEVTADPRSTEELLEETERLLDEGAGPSDEQRRDHAGDRDGAESAGAPDASADGSSSRWWRSGNADGESGTGSAEASATSRSWLSRLRPSVPLRSPSSYFSPKALLALLLVVSAGFVVGDTVIPIAGSLVGVFGMAFLIGLVTSKRRYLEMAAAGSSVGIVAAMADYAIPAFAGGYEGRIVAIGATTGLLACLLGYYFGRDFRDGLVRDVE